MIGLFLIAFSLSMDSFAVSIANGISWPQISFYNALKIAFIMGGFHILMPLIGYYISNHFIHIIENIDHWVAFVLLAFLGIKMIIEALSKKDDVFKKESTLSFKRILIQSIATSIDALIIGVTLYIFDLNILFSTTVIGVVTFIMVLIGLRAGKSIGSKLGSKFEILGGIGLIIIAIKILIEHTL